MVERPVHVHDDDWSRSKLRQLLTYAIRLAEMWQRLSARRFVRVGIFCVVVGLAAISIYWRFSPQSAAACLTDFSSDFRSSVLVSHGVSPYGPLADWIRAYRTGQPLTPFSDTSCLSGRLEFTYTPFFALLLTPFTWLSYARALVLWDVTSLLMLAGAIIALLRATRIRLSPLHLILLTATAVLTSPLRYELYYAQADIFLLFFISLSLWARLTERPQLAGVLLAVACATEPALLAGLLLLVWKREYRFAAVALGSSLALILAPFLWLGGAAFQNLLTIWHFYANAYAVSFSNDAPKGVLLRLLSANPYAKPLAYAPQLVTPLWLLVVVVVGLVTASLTSRCRLSDDSAGLLDVGLAVAALLLISPWSENNSFTLLILSFLVVFAFLVKNGRSIGSIRRVFIGFTLACVMFVAIGDPIQYALLARAQAGGSAPWVLMLLDAVYLYPLAAVILALLSAKWYLRVSTATSEGVSAVKMHPNPNRPRSGISDMLERPDLGEAATRLSRLVPSQHAKVHIIGGPGSGKTTFGRQVSRLLDVPMYELDVVAGAGVAPAFRMERPYALRIADVEAVARSSGWVTEGTYLWWTDCLLREAQVIIWLDVSPLGSLRSVLARHGCEYVQRIRMAPTISGKVRAARLMYLRHIAAFTVYTWAYYHRPEHRGDRSVEALDDGWALTRANTRRHLADYGEKVIRCGNHIEAGMLLARLATLFRTRACV